MDGCVGWYITGSRPLGIYAFAISKDSIHASDEVVIEGLKDAVKKKIGSFAIPQAFLV